MRTTVKDSNGRPIGVLEESGDTIRAYDTNNRLLAIYEKRANVTKDPIGRVLAEGNVTTAFMYKVK